MPSVKAPKPPKAGDMNGTFLKDKVQLRGQLYEFQELSIAKYDEIIQLATSTRDDGTEMLDNGLLNKFLVVESCVNPKLTLELLAEKGVRIGRKLQSVAIRLNYGDELDELDKKEDDEPDIQEGEPEEEGEDLAPVI